MTAREELPHSSTTPETASYVGVYFWRMSAPEPQPDPPAKTDFVSVGGVQFWRNEATAERVHDVLGLWSLDWKSYREAEAGDSGA